MDLNQLAVFSRVVEAGSFTRAAQQLRQPKSRVSRQIASLEKALGTALLLRSTRQLSLTEAGRALYEKIRTPLYDLESASQMATEHEPTAGLLRVTAAEDLGLVLLTPFLNRLGREFPALRIEARLTNDYVDLVKEGVDLAIRIGALKDTSLRQKKLGDIQLIPVASPEMARRWGLMKDPAELASHPALVFAPGTAAVEWTFQGPGGERRRVKPHAFRSSNNPQLLLAAALDHQGLAVLPDFVVQEALRARRLKRLFPQWSGPRVPVQLLWPAHRESRPLVRLFIERAHNLEAMKKPRGA
ncbi:MAG: LysR family transcriptional regulator [Bdellovibrionaceae bacterium]|nr:LysR family transcriptional regulator [Pseudobdellovibrionaceae bacterium]